MLFSIPSVEATFSLATSSVLLVFSPSTPTPQKALLFAATLALAFHEAFLKLPGAVGRQPSGLTQGALLIPWLLCTCSDSAPGRRLCVAALTVGLLFGAISLLWLAYRDAPVNLNGIGIGFMAYAMAVFLALTLLTADLTWDLLLWLGATCSGVMLEMYYLAESFSQGEMFVCAELLSTLIWAIAITPHPTHSFLLDDPASGQLLSWITRLLLSSVAFSVFGCLSVRQWTVDWSQSLRGLTLQKRRNQIFSCFVHFCGTLSAISLLSMIPNFAAILRFSVQTHTRRYLLAYWITLLSMGIAMAEFLKTRTPTIVMRKWFHFIAIGLFLPGLLMEPVLLQLALVATQSLFFLTEGLRLAHLPELSPAIDRFLSSFTDHRDRGPLIVSHFSLLLGLALPIWMAPIMQQNWEKAEILGLSGLMALGIGDSFAAIVGTWYGRTHWAKGLDKSVEGCVACFVTTLLGWGLVSAFWSVPFRKLVLPTVLAALFEASSGQNDNLFLPLYYLTMLNIA